MLMARKPISDTFFSLNGAHSILVHFDSVIVFLTYFVHPPPIYLVFVYLDNVIQGTIVLIPRRSSSLSWWGIDSPGVQSALEEKATALSHGIVVVVLLIIVEFVTDRGVS